MKTRIYSCIISFLSFLSLCKHRNNTWSFSVSEIKITLFIEKISRLIVNGWISCMSLNIIMLLLVFPCSQKTSLACLYKLSNINWICWFWIIRTEQAIRIEEPSSSATEFERSKDNIELEEAVPKGDDDIVGELQVETGRSGDEGTNIRSSGQQLRRNLRSSKTVSFREKNRAKAYVPLQISFFIFMSCSNHTRTSVYVLP